MRIGLSGPIGAGKSTVAGVWRELGAVVVEGDEMGRLALDTDAELRRALAARFGAEVLNWDGSVNRRALARAAFASADNQQDLTRLTFPTLYRLARQRMEEAERQGSVAVFDAALIFEWGVEEDFDVVAVVSAPPEVLVKRAAERLNVGVEQAEARLRLQLPAAEKERRADVVIMNDGDAEELRRKARRVWEEITRGKVGRRRFRAG